MATAVDWTVSKLLGFVDTLNRDATREQARIRANRARYMTTLRSVANVRDPNAKARIKAELTTWIHKQVAVENAFNEFLLRFAAAKAKVKAFLQSIHVTPPAYLGAIQVVPAAIIIVVAAAATAITIVVVQNNLQGKGLDGLQRLIGLASAQNWTPEQTETALEAYRRTLEAAEHAGGGDGDPFGIGNALEKAVPVLMIVAAIILLPKFMGRRAAA